MTAATNDSQPDPFASLYRVRKGDRSPFGSAWVGPETFAQGEWTLVARYPATSSDGVSAEVHCLAAPARFYSVRTKAHDLDTGSGKAHLAAQMAEAFAQGCLGVKNIKQPRAARAR